MADSAWPEFTRVPLPDGRTWSAQFDSYDQYRDLSYYDVQLFDGDAQRARITVCIAVIGDNWDTPEWLAWLRDAIAAVATTGVSNTTHVAYAAR